VDAGVDCNAGAMEAADVVFTERGPVRGQVSANGRAFRGIPYVKPPVGALRWRPPEVESACWPGVREAISFGAKCPQIDQQQGQAFDAGAPVEGSEDCLTVNVFTPAGVGRDAGLPVMAFIHGGGNTGGSASEAAGNVANVVLYDGTALAQRGNVIVVTMQYRLGVLGYLTMPVLDAESDAGVSGNYGLQDQQAALKWVQRNVATFGGDPSRVLLFGESAGAVNTCTHLAMPGSAGLFQRALVQSGSCSAALQPAVRRAEAALWLPGTGCHTAGDVPVCLRALTPEQLIRAYPVPIVVGGRRPPVSWGPVVDGKVLPQVPADALRGGTHHKVPIVIGSNSEETGVSTPLITTEAEYRAAVTGLVGAALTDRAMMLYPSAIYGSPRRALVQVTTDAFFGCQARIASRVAARGQPGIPVYRYLFSRAIVPSRGAFHGLELSYVFQKLSELLPMPPAADAAVEAAILGAWTRFAATGDPNGGSLPRWPGVSAPEPFLQLDSVVTNGTGWRNAECDFWDAVAGVMIPPPP
jgi:para-nitrobenzyl esterase